MSRHQLKNFGYQLEISVLAVLMAAALLLTEAAPSFAQFRPSNRGMPGRREGGGTRGGCLLQQPGLIALMPESNLGTTLAPDPTFFWYVPQNSVAAAEFVLIGADNTEIYKAQIAVPTEAGIVSLQLPPDQPLEVGQSYRWYFSLICEPLDRSADIFTSGWVERVELSAELSDALTAAPAVDVPALYAKAGLWQDALTALANLRQSEPQNPAFAAQWQDLLQDVGLEALADQPISSLDLAAP